jgi:predicted patatin/cPLA2 family phospholipase
MMQKVGLVLEGGAMRGLYTAGVLDTFLEENIEVAGIIAVSAGALFGANYFSNQKGRTLRYNKNYCKDKRYISIHSLITTGNIVNKDFAFYKITNELEPFDNDTFIKNNKEYYAVITNVESGEAEYINIKDVVENLEVLRASSAMPMVSKMVEINGNKYLDGALADSIPVDKAKELGFDKIIVILTRPVDYRKKPFLVRESERRGNDDGQERLRRQFRGNGHHVGAQRGRKRTYLRRGLLSARRRAFCLVRSDGNGELEKLSVLRYAYRKRLFEG